MTPRIVVRPQASRDIDEHAEHIAEDNLPAALRFYVAVERTFDRLAGLPLLGVERSFENPRLRGLRMWPISGFRRHVVFYRPLQDGIEVIRILHSARHFPTALRHSLERR